MITKEDLQQKYVKFKTEDLLAIIDQRHEYTDLAVVVALEELSKRNVTETEILKAKEIEKENAKIYVEKNIIDSLTFFQKNLYYFIWLPLLTFAWKRNLAEEGYVLKLRQASYYSILGFIFFMLTGISEFLFAIHDIPAIAIWISGFLVASVFDEKFNREYLKKRLLGRINNEEK